MIRALWRAAFIRASVVTYSCAQAQQAPRFVTQYGFGGCSGGYPFDDDDVVQVYYGSLVGGGDQPVRARLLP